MLVSRGTKAEIELELPMKDVVQVIAAKAQLFVDVVRVNPLFALAFRCWLVVRGLIARFAASFVFLHACSSGLFLVVQFHSCTVTVNARRMHD